MAATGISSATSQKNSQGFIVALASAALEWLLIFLLFVDAIFSYLVTGFARYCELQTPCLLCSRLDHVLGNEKLGFYWDLICRNHKLEISSLVFCHAHNKLVDVRGMCESCLFSFATINKSNAETYRLLVGKLGVETCIDLDDDLLPEHQNLGSSSKRCCSCCSELCISRSYAQKLLQTKSVGSEAAEFDLPLTCDVAHDHDDLKKRRDKSCGLGRASQLGNNGFDPLSHIGYTELKITSDTESDAPLSDDDDAGALVCETDDNKEDFQITRVQLEPCIITSTDNLISEKLTDPPLKPEPSLLVSQLQSVVIKSNGGTPVTSTIAIDHGLEELIWQQAEPKMDPPVLTELISPDAAPPSSSATETTPEVLRESNVSGSGELGQTSATETVEISKTGSGPMTTSEVAVENGSQMPNNLELGDAYKLAVGNRGRQLSGLLAEQWAGKDSARVNEDLKLLFPQISASRGIELPLNDMSPRVSVNSDELRSSDASGSIGLQILQKRMSLERNESGFESLDGSIVSEIEGESLVDRLKRQIEHDRKSLSVLCKELEEERNASAVAANQAMAMITRLQEEKAALHMEALQYLRMMEEQAEYDMEALQKANDHLAEKERDMQDLEEELEFYRKKFPIESMLVNIVDAAHDLKAGDMRVERSDASCAENNASLPSNSVTEKPIFCDKLEGSDVPFEVNNISSVKNPLSELEDERLYISQCLKKLEKKLHLFSNNAVYLDLANGECSGNEGDEVSNLKKLNCKEGSEENKKAEEDSGSPSVQGGHFPSLQNSQFVSKENGEFNSCGQDSSMICRETNLVTLGNEISDLNDRLKSLEADRNFLEHIINFLRNGDEGLQFIQEIVHHLRELRRTEARRRDQTVG